jgi:hypothetical protein
MTAVVPLNEDFVSVNTITIGDCAFQDPGLFKR